MKKTNSFTLSILISFCFLIPCQAQIVTTFAGSTATLYGGDGGPATIAKLNDPTGVAIDASGNIYIADRGNNRIRKVDPAGNIITYAGTGAPSFGGDSGPAFGATINSANGIAVDIAGNVYIADYNNNRIRKINTSGIITTIAGNGVAGFGGDGMAATNAQLNQPSGVAVDVAGNVYIADLTNQRIRKVNASGIISTIAGNGVSGFAGDGGAAIGATLHQPTGIAVDAIGNVFIADQLNARIRKINTSGFISTVAGDGTLGYSGDGGSATACEFYQPTGVTVDASGNLFIADLINNRIRKVNTAGIISTVAGNGAAGFTGDGGLATAAQIHFAFGLTTDASGNLYIADGNNNRIRKINASGIISTIAGNGIASSGDGGPASSAQLLWPQDVAIDAAGNVYVSEYTNNRIRKINTAGIISTIAGNGIQGFSGDGGPATGASLNWPIGLAIDPIGNLYFADASNSRIRKINPAGIITTVAGITAWGFSGDGGPATNAQLNGAQYVTTDAIGNVYISDGNNYRVRKINPLGIITTIAGTGGYGSTGDGGPATNAEFNQPAGIVMDASGNLLVTDPVSNNIRKINPSGIISTIAGNGVAGYTGDGGPASACEFRNVVNISNGYAGNLLISDEVNNCIRLISPSGVITTIAGTGIGGYSGDGGPATAAQFYSTVSAKMDNLGNIYIADFANNVIRKISGSPSLFTSLQQTGSDQLIIFPNPANLEITINYDQKINNIVITNLIGQIVYNHDCNKETAQINIADFAPGVYLIKINNHLVRKFIKQ
jgi:sugar lactone lactonase YvrE